MSSIYKIILWSLNSLLRCRGMKIGAGSFIHPLCDTFFVDLKGINIGNNVLIGRGSWLSNISGKNQAINIGSGSRIGRNFVCHAASKITIGDGCLFSYSVSILDHNHKFLKNQSPVLTGIDEPSEIIIGKNTFIGAHSFVLKTVIPAGQYEMPWRSGHYTHLYEHTQ
jgi:acetyltransferase-like isoleucine patch superfamily enzyme